MSLALRRRAMGAPPPAAPGGPLVSDAFNRADSTTTLGTADTGQAWTVLAGTWGIETNRAYSSNSGTPEDRQVVVESNKADVTASVDLAVLGASGGPGLTFRAVDASNYWIFIAEPQAPRWALYKRVTGTHTLVASLAQTPTTGRLSVVTSAASIICKLDGATLMSVTDAAHQTATRHGLRIYSAALPSDRFDNFEVAA